MIVLGQDEFLGILDSELLLADDEIRIRGAQQLREGRNQGVQDAREGGPQAWDRDYHGRCLQPHRRGQ